MGGTSVFPFQWYFLNVGKNANQLNYKRPIQASWPQEIIVFTHLQNPCLRINNCQVCETIEFRALLEARGNFENNSLWQCPYVSLHPREVFSIEWNTWPMEKAAGMKITSTDSLVHIQWKQK